MPDNALPVEAERVSLAREDSLHEMGLAGLDNNSELPD